LKEVLPETGCPGAAFRDFQQFPPFVAHVLSFTEARMNGESPKLVSIFRQFCYILLEPFEGAPVS